MNRNIISTMAVAVALTVSSSNTGLAQHYHGEPKPITLHVNPRWKECSFQLDAALTQKAFRQFTREAGIVTYFRPLTDARPMRAGEYEFSLLQWKTGIDDTEAAWNDTFVHPDSAHYLFEGSGLQFPGFSLRRGMTDKLDVGAYFTKSPNANYGFYGGQVQYNVAHDTSSNWAASARVSFVSLYGPEDLDYIAYGADLVASKTFAVSRWVAISPYAGVSTYLARSHEKSSVVDLSDENVLGAQATLGVSARVSVATLAVEYSAARVRSSAIKLGVAF